MPLFRLETRLAEQNGTGGAVLYKFRYSWWVNLTGIEQGEIAATAIWTRLRECHRQDVFAYQYYITDSDPLSSLYAVGPIPEGISRGALPVPPSEKSQSWNTVRVDLNVAGSRPSRKFLRPGLRETDTAGDTIASNIGDLAQDAFDILVDEVSFLRDESDNTFIGAQVFSLSRRKLGKTARADLPNSPPVG